MRCVCSGNGDIHSFQLGCSRALLPAVYGIRAAYCSVESGRMRLQCERDLVYLTVSGPNDRMIVNNELERVWKESDLI
jgi:hypothetical protein